jgi:hypothetical protein
MYIKMNKEHHIDNCPPALRRLIGVAKTKERKPYVWSTVAVAKYKSTFIEGWNSNKTSPKFYYKNVDQPYEKHSMYNRHAELHVLQKLNPRWDYKKVKIFVSRINNSGEVTMAKPCPSCQLKLRTAGILAKNVHYTDWDGSWSNLEAYEY